MTIIEIWNKVQARWNDFIDHKVYTLSDKTSFWDFVVLKKKVIVLLLSRYVVWDVTDVYVNRNVKVWLFICFTHWWRVCQMLQDMMCEDHVSGRSGLAERLMDGWTVTTLEHRGDDLPPYYPGNTGKFGKRKQRGKTVT